MKNIKKLINHFILNGHQYWINVMNILNKIISIFNPPPNITPPSKKTIRQLDLLSDVWVKDGDIVYKGMVWDITRRHITVIYGEDSSYKFRISKQEDIIEQDNKILYCNEPEK